MINKAISHFGTTQNINECGYILTNGNMLDFSGFKFGGSKGSRTIDHREIADIYETDIIGINAMIDFMNNGNIRVNSESQGLDISNNTILTQEQKETIRNYVNHFKGNVFIDISNIDGKNVTTLNYQEKTASSRILSDIQEQINKSI